MGINIVEVRMDKQSDDRSHPKVGRNQKVQDVNFAVVGARSFRILDLNKVIIKRLHNKDRRRNSLPYK